MFYGPLPRSFCCHSSIYNAFSWPCIWKLKYLIFFQVGLWTFDRSLAEKSDYWIWGVIHCYCPLSHFWQWHNSSYSHKRGQVCYTSQKSSFYWASVFQNFLTNIWDQTRILISIIKINCVLKYEFQFRTERSEGSEVFFQICVPSRKNQCPHLFISILCPFLPLFPLSIWVSCILGSFTHARTFLT